MKQNKFNDLIKRKEQCMDEILIQYQARGSYKQKTRFIEYIRERLKKRGFDNEINIDEYRVSLFRTRNIIVGNPNEADIIITAHYDTSPIWFWSFWLAPTNAILYNIGICLFIFKFLLWSVIVAGILAMACNSEGFLFEIYMVVVLAIGFQLLFGIKNWHTANDNTSGVITLLKILEATTKEQRQKVCAIFFDNEEKRTLGSKKLSQSMPDINKKLLINFDCVGDGENIVSLYKEKAKNDRYYELLNSVFEELSKAYDVKYHSQKLNGKISSSDHNNFDKGVAIYALNSIMRGMRTTKIHTLFDNQCRNKNIEFLTSAMITFINRISDL